MTVLLRRALTFCIAFEKKKKLLWCLSAKDNPVCGSGVDGGMVAQLLSSEPKQQGRVEDTPLTLLVGGSLIRRLLAQCAGICYPILRYSATVPMSQRERCGCRSYSCA